MGAGELNCPLEQIEKALCEERQRSRGQGALEDEPPAAIAQPAYVLHCAAQLLIERELDPVFAQPDPFEDDGEGSFGVITSTVVPARQLQFGLKLNF